MEASYLATRYAYNCRAGASPADPSNGKRERLPYNSALCAAVCAGFPIRSREPNGAEELKRRGVIGRRNQTPTKSTEGPTDLPGTRML